MPLHVTQGLDLTELTGKACPDKSNLEGDRAVLHLLGLQGSKLKRADGNNLKRHFAPESLMYNPTNHFKEVVPAHESRI